MLSKDDLFFSKHYGNIDTQMVTQMILKNLENGTSRNREPTILENSKLGFIESVHEN